VKPWLLIAPEFRLDMGIPLNDLQAQLGHTDLKTTSVYLKADINHRRKSYEGFEI